MITGRQIRAARGLLDWDATALAEKAGLTRATVGRIEAGTVQPQEKTLARIAHVFDLHGIEFLDQSGVRSREDKVREINGPDCYAHLLDEIYYQLTSGDEFLVAWADEKLSPAPVHAAYKRIYQKGIRYRKLIQQDNTHICGPLEWYRYVEPKYYQNATAVFFQDKSAYLTEDWKRVIILRDNGLAQANKNFFELTWSYSKQPLKTIVGEKYE